MKELIEKVRQWGLDRDIVYTGKDCQDKFEMMKAQAEYTLKEVSEISDAYANDSLEEFIDGIGDTLVTLIVGASSDDEVFKSVKDTIIKTNELNFTINKGSLNNEICFSDLYMDLWRGSFNLVEEVCEYNINKIIIVLLFGVLIWVNYKYDANYDYKDCLEYAYNEIKDRKGKVVNGQFIKEE